MKGKRGNWLGPVTEREDSQWCLFDEKKDFRLRIYEEVVGAMAGDRNSTLPRNSRVINYIRPLIRVVRHNLEFHLKSTS